MIVRATVADVDLDAIEANFKAVRERAGVGIMAVVKADAYGHGAEAIADVAMDAGAVALVVATVEEAVVLRRTLPRAEILVVLGAQEDSERDAAVSHRLGLAVWDLQRAKELGSAARAARTTAAVHFKVDTGLSRLGAPLAEAADRFNALGKIEGLRVEGVFTHLARSDEADLQTTHEQLDRFDRFLDAITLPRWVHTSATGAIESLMTRARITAVRPGLALLGLHAAPHLTDRLPLQPALRWSSRVIRLAAAPKGTGVSYGHLYRMPRDGLIATVPVGYGDGLPRAAGGAQLLVRGVKLTIAGLVGMECVMLDVSEVDGVREGDEVVVIGSQSGATATAEDLATACGTTHYEIVTAIRPRVPRRYLRGGRVVALKTLADGYVRI